MKHVVLTILALTSNLCLFLKFEEVQSVLYYQLTKITYYFHRVNNIVCVCPNRTYLHN